MELKLLYTYEEWLERKQSGSLPYELSEEVANELIDAYEAVRISMDTNASEEEKAKLKEWQSKSKEREQRIKNEEYTDLTHRITDMCLNPQDADIDFEQIGKLQFKLERLKYPVVKPY